MDLLAEQPPFPGFQNVRHAYDVALELPQWRDAPITVGVCRANGELAARGRFRDHRQARLFTIQMQALGYREADGEQGCDRMYVREEFGFH